jgi:DNA repair protein SbcD/Mre11
MKIAITSDIHLKSISSKTAQLPMDGIAEPGMQNPERFNALRNILDQMFEGQISHLIIAGDLFDQKSQDYSIFDQLAGHPKYSKINFYIIPGNHDSLISGKYFTSENIRVFNEPEAIAFKDSQVKFFFIPYIPGRSMGEVMAGYFDKNREESLAPGSSWILIGHGDYLGGNAEPNIYEKGIYMPLSRRDIEYYGPAKVILGHIHKKMQAGKVIYPGSACGMDINETGKKSFVVLDLNDLSISEKIIGTDVIFVNETIVMLPAENEQAYIEERIEELIKGLDLNKEEIGKVRLRLKLTGYSQDKNRLEKIIKSSLAGFTFYDGAGPDLSEVFLFNDPERISIVQRVKDKIELISKEGSQNYISEKEKKHILQQATHLILKE